MPVRTLGITPTLRIIRTPYNLAYNPHINMFFLNYVHINMHFFLFHNPSSNLHNKESTFMDVWMRTPERYCGGTHIPQTTIPDWLPSGSWTPYKNEKVSISKVLLINQILIQESA